MVLLMMNMFAQAQVQAQPVTGVEPVNAGATSAIAIPVDDTKTDPTPTGTSYEMVMTGIPVGGKKGVQGQQKPCEVTDANGRCHPMPNKAKITDKRDVGKKGKRGTVTGTTPAATEVNAGK